MARHLVEDFVLVDFKTVAYQPFEPRGREYPGQTEYWEEEVSIISVDPDEFSLRPGDILIIEGEEAGRDLVFNGELEITSILTWDDCEALLKVKGSLIGERK